MSSVPNYLGFPSGISGGDLARRAVDQARKFGVEILTPQEATALRVKGPYKHLTLSDGSEIACHVLMLSVGVSWNLLPAAGADRLAGAGVFYGAAMTEAPHVKGQTVCIVGGGNSAGQAAMYFKDYADNIVMILRGSSLGAKMSHYLVNRIESADNIEVRLNTEIGACQGSERLEALELREKQSGGRPSSCRPAICSASSERLRIPDGLAPTWLATRAASFSPERIWMWQRTCATGRSNERHICWKRACPGYLPAVTPDTIQ